MLFRAIIRHISPEWAFGSCLDGSDQNIRLERYMHGDNAWKIERCYMQRDDYEYVHSQQVRNKDNREER